MSLPTEPTTSPLIFHTDPIRVLHIFPPSLRSRFGGQNIYWKSMFMKWNHPTIIHSVLETRTNQIIAPGEAFNFEYEHKQRMTPKRERITWAFSLFSNLVKYQKNYDILHVHILWWGSLLMGPWASRKKIPVIYESVLLNEDTPGGIINEHLGKLKLWCLRKYAAILTISDSLTGDYLNFGFHASQVRTLMNAVDSDIFLPSRSDAERKALRRKYALPEDAKILLFVGSLIERKGVDLLIKAFIEAEREDKSLYLVLVGARNKQENPSLDEELISHLQEVLDKNRLGSRVKFMGLVQERAQLAEIYRAADIFVFPSRNEGLGNVVLEAMACGLPMIVSRLPVLESVIRNGENGIFVPVDDSDVLADAIVQLAADPAKCQTLGQAANRYTITHHGFAEWQARLVEFYRNLIREG